MAKTKNAAPEVPTKSTGGRGIAYPALSLEDAIKRARQFWDHERKNAAPIEAAAAHWGYSPTSSGVRTLIAALLSYGLLVDKGNGDNRQVQLTNRALDIVLGAPEKSKSLIEAVKSPKIYAELLNLWSPENLPSDQTIKVYLLRNKNFNPKAVDGFVEDFRSSVSFSGIKNADIVPVDKLNADAMVAELAAQSDPAGRAAVSAATGAAAREKNAKALFERTMFGPGVEVASYPVAENCIVRLIATGQLTAAGVGILMKHLQLGLDVGLYPGGSKVEQKTEPA